MAQEATGRESVVASDWGGGKSPFAVGWPKLMMWLFLVSDTLTFAGLLAGYGVVRISMGRWPVQAQIFNLYLVGAMTFILICSRETMAVAVSAAKRGDSSRIIRFLLLTVLGGLLFLSGQAYEWTHFIREGGAALRQPLGHPPVFRNLLHHHWFPRRACVGGRAVPAGHGVPLDAAKYSA